MSLFTKLGNEIASPVDAAGNLRSVLNGDMQRWLTEAERLFMAVIAGQGGDIDLPNLMIRYTVTGGTADAIVATPNLPVPAAPGLSLFSIQIEQTNTGNVTINGKALLTNSGNEIVAGGLPAGSIPVFMDLGDHNRLLSDQVSAAIQQAAEAAADAANAAAGSLLFRILPTVTAAQASTIDASAAYVAVAEFSPQPRFYKRFTSDPGAGDRFQSVDGAFWQGLPLPSLTLDFANPVLRTSSASLVSGDMDRVHSFTVPVSTTYTCTLPNPANHVGKLLHIVVDDRSRGLLAMAYTTNPIARFAAGGLKLWAGESLTLLAKANEWEIIGGRCIPCTLFATCPGASIGMLNSSKILDSGWQTALAGTMFAGAAHAINSDGQVVIPRAGFYQIYFDCGYSWTGSPTTLYCMANASGNNLNRTVGVLPASGFEILHATHAENFAAGTLMNPISATTGGAGIYIDRVSFGPPQFKLVESPQW